MSAVRYAILDHLLNGGVITKITAIYPPFQTTNLGNNILLLRRAGHPVEKRWRRTADGKKRFAEFYLPQKDQG